MDFLKNKYTFSGDLRWDEMRWETLFTEGNTWQYYKCTDKLVALFLS
jgi:hypothetical protein